MSEKISEEKLEEIEEKVARVLVPQGKSCGEKIAKVVRERGYDTVIPLYRSAVAIEVEKDNDGVPYVSIKSFDDPHFWGATEITDETVKDEGRKYTIRGGRSGIRIYDAIEGEMMSRATHERIEEI